MNTRALASLLYFDLKATLFDKVAVFFLLMFPLGLYFLFATFFGAMATPESAREYYEQNTINFAAVMVLNIALLNLAPATAHAKQMGLLQRLLVTPVPVSHLWLAGALRALVVYVIGYLVLILSGYLLFGMLPAARAQLVLPALITSLSILPLGFLIGLWFNNVQSAFNAGMVAIQPMLILSGAGFPVAGFPGWAQALSDFIPYTYAVRIMRMGWEGTFFSPASVMPSLILLGTGLVCSIISMLVFRRRFQ